MNLVELQELLLEDLNKDSLVKFNQEFQINFLEKSLIQCALFLTGTTLQMDGRINGNILGNFFSHDQCGNYWKYFRWFF